MSHKKLKAFEAEQLQQVLNSPLYPSEISYLLYQADPLSTGCMQNAGMEGEHDQIGRWIYDDLNFGEKLSIAVFNTLSPLFDEDKTSQIQPEFVALLTGVEATEFKTARQQRIDAMHVRLFPESYDHINDNIEDARIRRSGKDPMPVEYQSVWKAKRRELGIGEEIFNPESLIYAEKMYAHGPWTAWPNVNHTAVDEK
jgi:hypothetical protein